MPHSNHQQVPLSHDSAGTRARSTHTGNAINMCFTDCTCSGRRQCYSAWLSKVSAKDKKAKKSRTKERWDPARLGNLCFGVQESLVGVGAVERGLEGNAPQAPRPPQLQQGLLADYQRQHCMYKGPAHTMQVMHHIAFTHWEGHYSYAAAVGCFTLVSSRKEGLQRVEMTSERTDA